jgi:aspartate aminotransferase
MKKTSLNERIAAITPSITLGMEAKAKDLTAKGRKVYSFAAGEPDFDTPAHIKLAAVNALSAAQTKYAPVAGLQALRCAISDKLARENNLKYDAAQIVISNGAKHSLFNIFMALCKEGDEVIIPAPYWLSYPEMVKIAGGKCVFVNAGEKNDFKMTAAEFEAAITSRTKALVINSPCNPVGNVYSCAELKSLAAVAVKHGVYIISDEIYEKMVYDGVEQVSIGSFSKEVYDLTITVNGFSKAYSMTGWRLGYFAGPIELVKAVCAFQSHSTSGANTFAMHGAIAALNGHESAESMKEMQQAFAERRDYLYGKLTSICGISCIKPMGAFYMLPNISKFGLGSVEFCERLLEKEGVALVPGAAFGSDEHVRLSYACCMNDIKDGVDKLERFVKSL